MYEDLREKMFDAVSSTLTQEGIKIAEARKDEEGKKKIMTALMGELFSSNSELRAAALHFCKKGNETQKQYRSGSVGSKDVRKVDNSNNRVQHRKAEEWRKRSEGVELRPSRQWHRSN